MSHELSDEARSVIRAAVAEEFRPGRAHRERLRRGLLVRAAAGSAVTLLGSSVAKASAKSLISTVAASLGLGFGAGLVIAGSAQLALNPSAAHVTDARVSAASSSSMSGKKRAPVAPTPTLAPDPPVSEPMAPQAIVPSAAEASARGTAWTNAPSVAPKARAGESAANGGGNQGSGSPLRAELDLMAQVQEALRDARGARALELIARYDAQHPSGTLETERLAAEVFAACQTGDAVRARRAAQRFLARDQRSALAERVKKACSSENGDPR